jgi:hypothetical protein
MSTSMIRRLDAHQSPKTAPALASSKCRQPTHSKVHNPNTNTIFLTLHGPSHPNRSPLSVKHPRPNMATTDSSSSYLNTTALLSPEFTPTSYANTLIHSTNNPSDTPLDLSTPLSRVLFDVQEVDTRIDALTTQNAPSIISTSLERETASTHVLGELEAQVGALQECYDRLQKEVGERWEQAEQVRLAAERMVRTLRLGRSLQRALALGRQVQGLVEEAGSGRGGERSMVPAAQALLGLRELFAATGKGEEAEGLGRVLLVATLRNEVVSPAERTLLARAQGVVREFSMSSLASGSAVQGNQGSAPTTTTTTTTTGMLGTFKETEDTKARATHALHTLYLLSPLKPGSKTTPETFTPTLLLSALTTYLQTALASSLASLTRALATLPTLDRTLLEIAARCQNLVALEALLSTTHAPSHPLLASEASPSNPPPQSHANTNFLSPLLSHLDTSSLPSYFWRSLASQLSSRVQEILNRGGVSARTLRSNKEKIRDAVRDCVERGSRLPVQAGIKDGQGLATLATRNWEREAAVMVGSIVGVMGR